MQKLRKANKKPQLDCSQLQSNATNRRGYAAAVNPFRCVRTGREICLGSFQRIIDDKCKRDSAKVNESKEKEIEDSQKIDNANYANG